MSDRCKICETQLKSIQQVLDKYEEGYKQKYPHSALDFLSFDREVLKFKFCPKCGLVYVEEKPF